jgi:hypothetical protein
MITILIFNAVGTGVALAGLGWSILSGRLPVQPQPYRLALVPTRAAR